MNNPVFNEEYNLYLNKRPSTRGTRTPGGGGGGGGGGSGGGNGGGGGNSGGGGYARGGVESVKVEGSEEIIVANKR